ncbi:MULTISPECIES: diaminobutyrate acetyltransferase [Isoptericola]|uniref:L-2,4-diaminobutyric acid acetyltransferase n=2 Tax=Isoptericola TaxID=254250 RepID=A0A849K2M2_9MICO|nr:MULTISPECIES: diaminobutyrate acetyltransferase [Isoptericola]MDO8149480.1 diaminobutyrate acetyltransferase [Isoptericola sp. b515]MDO8152426.1 diaminobutyrate acetyltransferase [Isoptericola sp. b408]NNU27458.1 diaminobutyrate acetyltransferase [Isoptericola sediminis]
MTIPETGPNAPATADTASRADEPTLTIRRPDVSDGGAMWRVARDSGELDLNSSYAYLLLADHFGDTCRIALMGDDVVGFVSGYRLPADPTRYFLWQVAVDERARGHRLAGRLIDAVIDAHPEVTSLTTTVTEDNQSSRRVFQRWAEQRGGTLREVTGFEAHHFPDGHEAEPLLVIDGFR